MKVTVVIDVFRAFTTAAYVLDKRPASYMLAVKQSVISNLAKKHINPLVIGKPEKGMEGDMYTIPNSPTRVLEVKVLDRDVIHRTEAGAKGVLQACEADMILAASFVNAAATAKYIKTLKDPQVTIMPMGHEGVTPSLEDTVCAEYIQAVTSGKKMNLAPYIPQFKEGPGKYFFSKDQWQYPSEDFDRCLEVDRFDFAIQAILVKDTYAILKRCQ
jgi:2-phosphosulfolactate phosphatase